MCSENIQELSAQTEEVVRRLLVTSGFVCKEESLVPSSLSSALANGRNRQHQRLNRKRLGPNSPVKYCLTFTERLSGVCVGHRKAGLVSTHIFPSKPMPTAAPQLFVHRPETVRFKFLTTPDFFHSCPWCGRNLEQYRTSPESLTALERRTVAIPRKGLLPLLTEGRGASLGYRGHRH
jgi:hypothetical protein